MAQSWNSMLGTEAFTFLSLPSPPHQHMLAGQLVREKLLMRVKWKLSIKCHSRIKTLELYFEWCPYFFSPLFFHLLPPPPERKHPVDAWQHPLIACCFPDTKSTVSYSLHGLQILAFSPAVLVGFRCKEKNMKRRGGGREVGNAGEKKKKRQMFLAPSSRHVSPHSVTWLLQCCHGEDF